jgi:hypothetical protein
MALGPVISILATGVASNMQTPLTTETVLPSEDLVLHVRNASGSSINVTFTDAGRTAGGSAATNPVTAVPATTGERFIYVPQAWMDTSTGLISVTFSATTSVTAEWLRV